MGSQITSAANTGAEMVGRPPPKRTKRTSNPMVPTRSEVELEIHAVSNSALFAADARTFRPPGISSFMDRLFTPIHRSVRGQEYLWTPTRGQRRSGSYRPRRTKKLPSVPWQGMRCCRVLRALAMWGFGAVRGGGLPFPSTAA